MIFERTIEFTHKYECEKWIKRIKEHYDAPLCKIKNEKYYTRNNE